MIFELCSVRCIGWLCLMNGSDLDSQEKKLMFS